jgi:hypothetical protein
MNMIHPADLAARGFFEWGVEKSIQSKMHCKCLVIKSVAPFAKGILRD